MRIRPDAEDATLLRLIDVEGGLRHEHEVAFPARDAVSLIDLIDRAIEQPVYWEHGVTDRQGPWRMRSLNGWFTLDHRRDRDVLLTCAQDRWARARALLIVRASPLSSVRPLDATLAQTLLRPRRSIEAASA